MFRHLSYMLIIVVSIFAVACSGGSAGYGTSPAPTQPPANAPVGGTTSGTTPAATGTVDVVIQNFAYGPQTLTVAAGTTVRWTQKDSAPHTATSTKGVFDSGNLSQGQTFSYTFTTPGTYPYICTYHPNMTATIIVQ